MKTMLQIEQTYYDLAMTQDRDVLLVCDRGFMDAVAYMSPNDWDEMKSMNDWNEVVLRDNRYDHVVHLVTAADGAENYYTLANNTARSEPIELAKVMDSKCQQAWLGHPYFDLIDNSTSFPEKINRLVRCVAARMGIDLSDRFDKSSTKRKWLVKSPLPSDAAFPPFEDFEVQHVYLLSPTNDVEARVRKRGKPGGVWSFQQTIRRDIDGRRIETRQQLTHRDYDMFLTQRDMDHAPAEMRRRCFMYKGHYFQLDTYHRPAKCHGLTLLTTYCLRGRDVDVPDFLEIEKEVTKDPDYSMGKLTLKNNSENSPKRTLANGNALVHQSSMSNGNQAASGKMIEELVESFCNSNGASSQAS